jgi:hypothetical protein
MPVDLRQHRHLRRQLHPVARGSGACSQGVAPRFCGSSARRVASRGGLPKASPDSRHQRSGMRGDAPREPRGTTRQRGRCGRPTAPHLTTSPERFRPVPNVRRTLSMRCPDAAGIARHTGRRALVDRRGDGSVSGAIRDVGRSRLCADTGAFRRSDGYALASWGTRLLVGRSPALVEPRVPPERADRSLVRRGYFAPEATVWSCDHRGSSTAMQRSAHVKARSQLVVSTLLCMTGS